MESLYPYLVLIRFNCAKRTLILLTTLLIGLSGFSQIPVPELIFSKPKLKTGTGSMPDGADGAVYIFHNVTTDVDALVTINGRSSDHVSLSSIDLTGPIEDPINGTGYDNAWQPRVAYDHGSAPANQSWWMEFRISFVQHSDINSPVSVNDFYVTGLDVDGDGVNLHEFLSFYSFETYTLEQNTLMATSNVAGCLYSNSYSGKEYDGPCKNYLNITPTATDVMVTSHYTSANNFVVRVGAKTGNTASNSADRMNALWFKNFQYNDPVSGPLPLSLKDFTAQLQDKKVNLAWSTDMELNVSHFTIQRSADGESFDDAGIIFSEGQGNAHMDYRFTDNVSKVNERVLYYRLKMVDRDAKYRYSQVVVVRMTGDQETLSLALFPNPATDQLRITIPSKWQNKRVVYNIYNTNGVLIKQKTSTNAGQTETLTVADLPSGIYIVRTANGAEEAVDKFIKSN